MATVTADREERHASPALPDVQHVCHRLWLLREIVPQWGSALDPNEQTRQERDPDTLKTQLGEANFTLAYAEGRTLSPAEATSDALALADALMSSARS
jgi:hypothetical protein